MMPSACQSRKELRAIVLTLLFFLPLLVGCGSGDDDGRRLGDLIVGTWQRGWQEGDVEIEGDTELTPDDLAYDRFVFGGDGSYNGMVRDGSFKALDRQGTVLIEGTYRCDNHNLQLTFADSGGQRQTFLMQVLSFTDDAIRLCFQHEGGVTVRLVIRSYSSSSIP